MAIDIRGYLNQLNSDPNTGGVNSQPSFDGVTGLPDKAVPTPEATYYYLVLWFLYIAGVVAVLTLIYGGTLYLTSAGEAEKAERAKKTIVGAIIGIIIIAISYSAYNYILTPLLDVPSP